MELRRPNEAGIRTTADLGTYLAACYDDGGAELVQRALDEVPDWMTFHEVRSAVGQAGLRLTMFEIRRG